MTNPLISVILPCYNVSNYIDDCIKSVLDQTYKNLEIILVDDGSTDNTGEKCDFYKKTDSRIIVFHKENGGLSDARNYGIERSSGQFITFVDSDDTIANNYVEYLYDLVEKNSSEIAFGSHNIIKNGKTIYKGIGINKIQKLTEKETFYGILLDREIDLSAWAKLYKKELFSEIRFPFGKAFEDTATTYKLISKSNSVVIGGNPIYNYKIRPGSITTTINPQKKYELIENTVEMCDFIKEKYPELERACNRRLVWAYFSTLNQFLKAEKTKEYKVQIKNMRKYLLDKKSEILKCSEYKKSEKIGIILLSFGVWIYNFVRKHVL